jgi:hypothetical protein
VQALPEQYRTIDAIEPIIDALGYAPDDDVERVLFHFAEADQKFYANRTWQDAVIRRGTLTAAMRIIDIALEGAFNKENETAYEHILMHLATLIGERAELRAYVYELLENSPDSSGRELLIQAVAKNPDAPGLLLLVQAEIADKRIYTTWNSIESVVTERIPAENWIGAYNVLPASTAELRRNLLAMTTDGGPSDAAARCLNVIDNIRDEFGAPESEPRHPDLASRKAWPTVASAACEIEGR